MENIEGHDGYQISNMGQVRSVDRQITQCNGRVLNLKGKILKQWRSNSGYLFAQLPKRHEYVHIMVATTFIPNPDGKSTVNHKYGNKLDNRHFQLEWSTQSENSKHAVDTGLLVVPKGEACKKATITEDIARSIKIDLKLWTKGSRVIADIAKRYNITYNVVNHIRTGHTWKHIKV